MTSRVLCAALLCLLATVATTCGQEQDQKPEAPTPKPGAIQRTQPTPGFWDRQSKIAAGATVGLLAWDSALTCSRLSSGGREHWINSQQCSVIVSTLALERVGAWSLAYLAHRHGWHKAERILEWAGPVGNAAGIGYSLTEGKPKPLELVCIAIKPGVSNCRIAPE